MSQIFSPSLLLIFDLFVFTLLMVFPALQKPEHFFM